MHILCPHCRSPIELVRITPEEILCPSCGSTFRIETESTTSWGSGIGGRALGRFELMGAVGTGAFGAVYKAHDTRLDRIVAVKAATGEEHYTLEGQADLFDVIAFSPEGTLVAASAARSPFVSVPGEIAVWEFDPQGTQRRRGPKFILKGHSDVITSLAFSPDGHRLLSCAGANPVTATELKMWDTSIGQELLTIKPYATILDAAQFSPDGWRVLALRADAKRPGSRLLIWDATPLEDGVEAAGRPPWRIPT
jgi:WD40 repeat protein